jgi:glycosyltransferase involved in cell wall biosynthesis
MGGYPWGGSEELWAATAMEALNAGHQVYVSVFGWTNKSPKLHELERRGATIFWRHNHNFQGRGALFGATSEYADLFARDPDVLVISQGTTFDFVTSPDLLELLYITPIPYVLVCQCNEDRPILTNDCRREHACNIFSRAVRVLFVSNQNRIDAERQLAMEISNSEIVLNPVNLADRSYLLWPELQTARFASVARLVSAHKGQDVLIEALGSDRWKQRDWQLTVYGSGPDEGYLRSLVEFLGLQSRITFAGHQSDVRAIWSKEQVLVMFSRAEGIPLALVEAMLCGRPAIVSAVGGNQEWVTEGRTGFVAEAPVVALAQAAMERAWSARPSWQAIGVEANRFATGRITDPKTRGLLEVLLMARQDRRPPEAATSDELERLKQYRKLLEPTVGRRANRLLVATALRMRSMLGRWRAARERSLLGLAEMRKTR